MTNADAQNAREPQLTPEIVLHAYAAGIFPMAESRGDEDLYWVDPEMRGILPLDGFHASRSLRRKVRRGDFEIRCDTAFADVIRGCAEYGDDRRDTWINDEIIRLFSDLHEMGHAHSVECYADGELAGGLYGVTLGGAFFGESMFSKRTDASKVALVHLIALLRRGGFILLDTQFVTEHLESFGAVAIPRADYHARLAIAIGADAEFYSDLGPAEFASLAVAFLQSSTQTS